MGSAAIDATSNGFELRYLDESGEHQERVTFRAKRHLHTRHVWPDGVVTVGRYWLNAWRERVRVLRRLARGLYAGPKDASDV